MIIVLCNPVKVARVHDWPTPENRTDVQAFIGFINFYRHFIRDFLTIARPLFNLTHSDKTWNWDTKEQEAFKCLKIVVTTAPVLVSSQDLKPFHIETNSLDFVKVWVKKCVITKKGEGHVISGNLGGLRTERRRWNPKSSNIFSFIFYFLSFRAL